MYLKLGVNSRNGIQLSQLRLIVNLVLHQVHFCGSYLIKIPVRSFSFPSNNVLWLCIEFHEHNMCNIWFPLVIYFHNNNATDRRSILIIVSTVIYRSESTSLRMQLTVLFLPERRLQCSRRFGVISSENESGGNISFILKRLLFGS